MTARTPIDRAARVRAALLALVADHGFRGASMAAVAERAGVAAGTAYVHYASKDALVVAVYLEIKRELSAAAVAEVDPADAPGARFDRIWHNVFRHLRAHADRARFLLQVDTSPFAIAAHTAVARAGADPLVAAATAPDMIDALADLPLEVLFDLGLGPAVRVAAAETPLSVDQQSTLARACWRAVRRPLRASG